MVGEHAERDDDRANRAGNDPGEAAVGAAAPQLTEDEAAVLAVNRRFYEAFESSDLEALAATWEHSDRVVCTHPGWVSIRGWSAVIESWEAIVNGGGPPQFILTNERVTVHGDVAWATVEENLIGRRGTSGAVAGLNVFVRGDDGEWRIVVHHGAAIAARPPS